MLKPTPIKRIEELFEGYQRITSDSVAASVLVLCQILAKPEAVEPSDDMVSLNQAAKILGMTPSGLRKLVERTKHRASGPSIEFLQTGRWGRIRFKRQWLEAFVAEHSHKQVKRTAGRRAPKRSSHVSNWDCT